MKRMKIVVGITVIILVCILGWFVFESVKKERLARLEVETNISFPVVIDGREMGKTPYGGNLPAREIILQVGKYETRLKLEPGIKTIVKRQFDESGQKSSGEIVSFEKAENSEMSLSIVSTPDSATITVDGAPRGFAPLKIDNLKSGTHTLSVSANGYSKSDFSINIVPGYKLVAIVDLFATAKVVATPIPTPVAVSTDVFVKILTTPTGFLRVRSEPTTASTEVGQVHPDETHKLLETDAKTGWLKIQISETVMGWISNTYAATVSGTIKL